MVTRYPFSAGDGTPSISVPSDACDCHVHVYDGRSPVAPGARLTPPDASVEQYREIQTRLGTSRVVLVTPSTYGCDNRVMVAGLAELGSQARGVAVIDGSESDAQLDDLHAAGVRGFRLNLSLGVVGSVDHILPLARRVEHLGWHLQLLMPPDLLATLAERLNDVPVPLVFDHFARLSPAQLHQHPAHSVVLKLLDKNRAWVKLSGGYIVSPQQSTVDPALDGLAQSYLHANPERVIWGSDWPHATASAGVQPMPDDAAQLDRLARWTGNAARLRQVLVHNPVALYGFAQ